MYLYKYFLNLKTKNDLYYKYSYSSLQYNGEIQVQIYS